MKRGASMKKIAFRGVCMSVTVDSKAVRAEDLGLRTVGELLTHVQKENRLVVRVLIDGKEPDRKRIGTLRKSLLNGHTVFIETADPQRMALDVLKEVSDQLIEAERMQIEAAEMLNRGQFAPAMEKLAGCFSTWQHAQESVFKTAQLLRLDLANISVAGTNLRELCSGFTRHLRHIRAALEGRDFASLATILVAETKACGAQLRTALETMRSTILSLS
jgi:hypothetical protein